MGGDLKVNLDKLTTVAKSWVHEVAPELRSAASSIDNLKYTQVEFGPLFIAAWSSYSKTAQFIQDRLNEAGPASEQIGHALNSAVTGFGEQQERQVKGTNRLTEEIGATTK
ncbi:hypothetical protein ACFVVM_16020 [Nocardia sp. NPDC058176]|uniref:hypothetical protein n=1 Tax=Nocardia sp. NPDC058176 TaxID=3346368 RepID=UPI0036DCAE35